MIIDKSKLFFTLLPILLLLLPLSAAAQSGHDVIFPSREISVRTALGEIEKQTDYSIAVNWENLDGEKVLQLPASRLSVKDVLTRAASRVGFRWEIIGSTIAIIKVDGGPKAETSPVYSTMHRTRLPSEMTTVPDPYSTRRISAAEISRIRNGQWSSDGPGKDSLGLVVLNFRVNSTTLERNYMDNAHALEIIHRTFSNKELLTQMNFITVTAAASPEGNTRANEKLSSGRAMAVKNYIMGQYPFMNRESIFTFSIGEDWTGLRKMVEDDPGVPYRSEVIDALDSPVDNDARRSMLRSIGSGSAYRYISRYMLPRLRGAAACMIYYKEEPEPVVITQTQTDTVYVDRLVEVEVEKIVEVERETDAAVMAAHGIGREPYYWGVKTNILYDAMLLPDIALEFSMGRKFSIEFGGQWSWWTTSENHKNAWRIQTAGIEPRLWLGDRARKTPLSGHFLGAYVMAGTYDVRLGGKTGYLSDMSYSTGISWGYATRIGRSWNMEFGLSLGYLGGKYETYHTYNDPTTEFYRDGRATRNYFGPTKARISFVWLPGGKNPRKK